MVSHRISARIPGLYVHSGLAQVREAASCKSECRGYEAAGSPQRCCSYDTTVTAPREDSRTVLPASQAASH